MMKRATKPLMIRAITLLALTAIAGTATGEDDLVKGHFWYESGDGDSSYSMNLEIAEGVAVPYELQGGDRVRVVLVGEPLDREAFLEAVADTGNVLFAAMRLDIDKRVEFDVCRYEDGTGVEICGIHFYGPGLSSSASGFGVYDHFTESVGFAGGRVSAKLKTAEPETEGNTSFGFDLTFDLTVAVLEGN